MVDEDNLTPASAATTKIEAEVGVPAASSTRSSKRLADTNKVTVSKSKLRRFSQQEKLAKVIQIDADIAAGSKLKHAVSSAGISDQTYYQWKKVLNSPSAQDVAAPSEPDAEFAEFAQLEKENQRLRTLLGEKLREENAALRKRLGLK